MIILHIVLSIVLFVIGFFMRYGYGKSITIFFYRNIPKLSKEEFDEPSMRKFVGDTSMKLASILLLIAMFGFFQPESFNEAIIVGWISVGIFLFASVTFLYKSSPADKIKNKISKRKNLLK
jgi:hypothetical protein